jgi:hypothetical protein
MIAAPARRQGEAVCFGHDGKTIYLTSEGSPCPLLAIPVKPQPGRDDGTSVSETGILPPSP